MAARSEDLLHLAETIGDRNLSATIRLRALHSLSENLAQNWFASSSESTTKTVKNAILAALQDDDTSLRQAVISTIVEVCEPHFPQDWPDLLEQLYSQVTENVRKKSPPSLLGPLSVLSQLYMCEFAAEEYQDEGVALKLLDSVEAILSNDDWPIANKSAALGLLKWLSRDLESCSPDILASLAPRVFDMLLGLSFPELEFTSSAPLWQTKSELYLCLSELVDPALQDYVKPKLSDILTTVMADLALQKDVYESSLHGEDPIGNVQLINETITMEFQVLQHITYLQGFDLPAFSTTGILPQLTEMLPVYACLSDSRARDYEDFNAFVEDETRRRFEIVTVRDSVIDLLKGMTATDKAAVLADLTIKFRPDIQSPMIESQVVLVANSYNSAAPERDLLLEKDVESLNSSPPLVNAALVAFLPNLLNGSPHAQVMEIMRKAAESHNELVTCAFVLSLPNFSWVESFSAEIQQDAIDAVLRLRAKATATSERILLESLSFAVGMHSLPSALSDNVLGLIFDIVFKDSTNQELYLPAGDCLSALLANGGNCERMAGQVLDKLLPLSQANPEKAEASLTLLEQLARSESDDSRLPRDIQRQMFDRLTEFILASDDENNLISASTVLCALLENITVCSIPGIDRTLLEVVRKLTSPDTPESAGAFIEDIVAWMNESLELSEDQYLDVVKSVTERLINISSVEPASGLAALFNTLVVHNPALTVEYVKECPEATITKIFSRLAFYLELSLGYDDVLAAVKALKAMLKEEELASKCDTPKLQALLASELKFQRRYKQGLAKHGKESEEESEWDDDDEDRYEAEGAEKEEELKDVLKIFDEQ